MIHIGSLFSGIGGLELGIESALAEAGIPARVIWQVEYDPFPRSILARHWPKADRSIADVRLASSANLAPVDLLIGGYPCQPFSHAGKRGGADDERHLWPEVARLLRDLRPRYAMFENVAGHLSLGFAEVLGDLAALGYDARWAVLRASDVGAPIGENGSSSAPIDVWPTASAMDGASCRLRDTPEIWAEQSRKHAAKGQDKQYPLGVAVQLGASGPQAVRMLGLRAWPTPQASDERTSTMPLRINAKAGGPNLGQAVRGSWPTPTAQAITVRGKAATGGPTLAEAAGNVGAMLNPAWVETLMGFPIGWTESPTDGPRRPAKSKLNGSRRAWRKTSPTEPQG